jgi:hypothetical protein
VVSNRLKVLIVGALPEQREQIQSAFPDHSVDSFHTDNTRQLVARAKSADVVVQLIKFSGHRYDDAINKAGAKARLHRVNGGVSDAIRKLEVVLKRDAS